MKKKLKGQKEEKLVIKEKLNNLFSYYLKYNSE